MNGRLVTGVIVAGSGATLMARLCGQSGQYVTAESIASIAWQASNLTTGQVAGSGTLTPASVLFDALQQNDPRWTVDSAQQPGSDGTFGYNFLATLPASTFASSPLGVALTPGPVSRYQIDVLFTPVSGEAFYAVFQATAIPVYL